MRSYILPNAIGTEKLLNKLFPILSAIYIIEGGEADSISWRHTKDQALEDYGWRLKDRTVRISINHVMREGNFVADKLASLAHHSSVALQILQIPPVKSVISCLMI